MLLILITDPEDPDSNYMASPDLPLAARKLVQSDLSLTQIKSLEISGGSGMFTFVGTTTRQTSGGPIINENGHVVGINIGSFSDIGGMIMVDFLFVISVLLN